ncbi:hypothetical protein ACVLV4_002538 [Rathayibacter agropyri]
MVAPVRSQVNAVRAGGLSAAGAVFCGAVLVLFYAILALRITLPAGTSELGVPGILAALGLFGVALGGFFWTAATLRRHGVTRTYWSFPVLAVAGAGLNIAQVTLLNGPYGQWLSGAPWPVVICLWSGPSIPAGLALLATYLVLRSRRSNG